MIDMLACAGKESLQRRLMMLAIVCWRGGSHSHEFCARAVFDSFLDDAMNGMLGICPRHTCQADCPLDALMVDQAEADLRQPTQFT